MECGAEDRELLLAPHERRCSCRLHTLTQQLGLSASPRRHGHNSSRSQCSDPA
ncbi:unnamed protein product [[Actinomadura] parvosata subsp. kistnae]|nr:unnamed protein product [Actinomadura parvosata subsp. kistnae]